LTVSEELRQLMMGALAVGAKAFSLWLVAWAIRRKGEFDYKLDWVAQLVRWPIVAVSFAAAWRFRIPESWAYRSVALIIGLAFLCWPNFAYHLANLFRRRNSTPQNSA
jgi:hypothetical protein